MNIASVLQHKQVSSDHDLDDPSSVEVHSALVQSKRFLKNFYSENYLFFKERSKNLPQGTAVELGSGGGFIKSFLPDVVTSDIMEIPSLDRVINATDLPYEDNSLSALYMIDALHHFQNCAEFFEEASRALAPGGKIVMVEPANTLWGRFIYQNFHHEPFLPSAKSWILPKGGPMSVANGALPWIVFVRDHDFFAAEFPELEVTHISYHFPFLYLLSGGVTFKQLLPDFCYPLVRGIEKLCSPLSRWLGMFMRVEVRKKQSVS